METKTVKTSTGYVATIRTGVTYGEWLKLQRILGGAMRIDPDTQKPMPMNGDAVFDANEAAVEFILISLQDDKGSDLLPSGTKKMDIMRTLDVATGSELMSEISSVWQKQFISQKKGIK